MRILHTADWHLGHRLYDRDRSEEHTRLLDWLLETIEAESVELLIVAGDVFDTMNPSNAARTLYYRFLADVRKTNCRHVVIVGGNHDSPTLLDAPAEVLRQLNVHVVGGACDELADQLLTLYDEAGNPEALVAAIPFLRDRDLRYSVVGETATDRIGRMKAAIAQHYADLGALAGGRQVEIADEHGIQVPIIATGHLFATGSEDAADKESHIYLADRNNIGAEGFPSCFDYIALGHVHQAQRVGGREWIRYSGAPLPLTFGEASRKTQGVCLLDLAAGGQQIIVEQLAPPRWRALRSVRGNLGEVLKAMDELVKRQRAAAAAGEWTEDQLRPWLEVRVQHDRSIPLLKQQLEERLTPNETDLVAQETYLPHLLRFTIERPASAATTDRLVDAGRRLSELRPEEVFDQLCNAGGEKRTDYEELLGSFRELRDWMGEREAVVE